MSTRDLKRMGAILLVTIGAGSYSRAQVTTGTILGTVHDNTGAAVVGAQVVITEVTKGTRQVYQTDDTGSYNAPFLIPGSYEVSVEQQGFKREVRSGITLQVDQKARIDLMLSLGTVSETVTVTEAAPLVRSTSAEVGDVVEQRAVRELPLNGRNFAQLVYLAPGVTQGQQGENLSGASTFNPRAASNFNALGSQANTNAWLVDGIDNNEYTFNTVIVQPSVESVREFKVLTGTYSAEFGRGAGVVSVSTNSGANEIHGSLFEFLRNDKLDARNYFNSSSQAKPPFRRNQFGASMGGPVILPKLYNGKNHTFFFADFYGLEERKGLTFVNSVPTALARTGDFSQYIDSKGSLIRIYDPLTTRLNPNYDPTMAVSTSNPQYLRDPFPGNVIPLGRINAVGANVASIYPLPNGPGNFNNYTSNVPRSISDKGFNFRIDHRISDNDSAFVRYSFEKFDLDAPQGQANCCLPTPESARQKFDLGPYVAGIQNTRLATQGLAFNEAHIFRANLLNEFRAGYARTIPTTVQSDFGHNSAASLGIQGINISSFSTGLPNINVTDMTGLSGGPNFLPANPRETHWQLEDNLSWTRGRHIMKFGYRYVRRMVSPFTNTDTRGTISFANNFTNDPITNSGGTGLATLLIGYMTNGATRGFLLEPYYMTNQDHAFFFQDDWKVAPRLTLNLGVRYDIFVPDKEIRNRLTNFDLVNLKLVYAGENGVSETANKQTRWGNVGPRIGLAYDLGGNARTILRAGYGISYFPEQASASNLLGQQVPYTVSQNISNIATNPTDYSNVPTIANPFPPVQTVKPATTAELNTANPRVLGHSFANQSTAAQTWSFNIERQINSSLMAEVGYAGAHYTHVLFTYNPNEVQPGTGTLQSRRLLQALSDMSNIIQIDPRNSSTYNSLQAKLVKNFSSGLQFLAAYTWAKSLDYGGSAASGGGNTGSPQTITNITAGRGPSGFDTKHRFVTSYLYELPFGSGKKYLSQGLITRLVGGWSLAGIVTLQTGRPYNVTLNTGVNNGATSWPNRIGSGTLDNPDPKMWFDTSAFVAPPANTYGNVARGVLYAPGQRNLDLSFVKSNRIHERFNLQFRLDTFNLFNTPFFGAPNAAIGSPTVGQITTTNGDNRDMQFALKLTF